MSWAAMDLHIIYTRSRMLLSKKRYASWKQIQDEFEDYVASLGPWPSSEVISYLAEDYPNASLSAAEQVQRFLESPCETADLSFAKA